MQPIAVAMGKKANAAERHLARCATHQGFCRPSIGYVSIRFNFSTTNIPRSIKIGILAPVADSRRCAYGVLGFSTVTEGIEIDAPTVGLPVCIGLAVDLDAIWFKACGAAHGWWSGDSQAR